MTNITAICPQLPVANVTASSAWYVRALGFKLLSAYPAMAILSRDGCELHLWQCDDPAIAKMSSAYFRSTEVDALYVTMQGASEGGRIKAPENRAWGMREFYIWDPDGNLLKFGQPVQEAM